MLSCARPRTVQSALPPRRRESQALGQSGCPELRSGQLGFLVLAQLSFHTRPNPPGNSLEKVPGCAGPSWELKAQQDMFGCEFAL